MGKRGRKTSYELNYIKECTECNKEFDIYGTVNWVWRRKNKYFCSYTCMCNWDKKNKTKKNKEDYIYSKY